MVPAEGGPKFLKLKSSWHRRRRSKILAVSLKHWKGRRGGGGGGSRGGVQGGYPPPPALYGCFNTSLRPPPRPSPGECCRHTQSHVSVATLVSVSPQYPMQQWRAAAFAHGVAQGVNPFVLASPHQAAVTLTCCLGQLKGGEKVSQDPSPGTPGAPLTGAMSGAHQSAGGGNRRMVF